MIFYHHRFQQHLVDNLISELCKIDTDFLHTSVTKFSGSFLDLRKYFIPESTIELAKNDQTNCDFNVEKLITLFDALSGYINDEISDSILQILEDLVQILDNTYLCDISLSQNYILKILNPMIAKISLIHTSKQFISKATIYVLMISKKILLSSSKPMNESSINENDFLIKLLKTASFNLSNQPLLFAISSVIEIIIFQNFLQRQSKNDAYMIPEWFKER